MMHPETEQALATIEVILEQKISYSLPCHEDSADFEPYFWEGDIQGEFTPLNLLQNESWIIETDPVVVIDSWLKLEQNCMASDRIYLYDRDPANIRLDDHTLAQRNKYYCNLLDTLIDEIEDLQAFDCNFNTDYSLFIITGKIPENEQYFCLSTTVPQETPRYINDLIYCSPYIEQDGVLAKTRVSKTQRKIENIIDKLAKIQIYGYYPGGYCNVHDFRLFLNVAATKENTINRALIISSLVEVYKLKEFAKFGRGGWGFDRYSNNNEQYLINFLEKAFPELLLYRFCFWDYEHLYIIGNKGKCDRVGISLHSQFTYNP